MPKFPKGSQEAKDYMKSIREKRTTTSNIDYESFKGKKSKKNITLNLEKDIETLPSGEKIIKSTTRRKMNGNPVEENINQVIVPAQPIVQQKKGGRPKKYNTAEEAKQAKKEKTLASNKKKYAERKALKQQQQPNGGSLDIGKSFHNIGHKIEKGFNKNIAKPIDKIAHKAVEYGKAVVYGRNDYPPKVRNILKKVGTQTIKSITIKRTPVSGLLTGALSFFSLGKFGKRLEKSFDELFHLFIEITLDNNQKVILEKNEVINMETNPKSRPDTESKLVNSQMPQSTLDEMLNNTEQYMGQKNFFGYSARDNNCQDFIVAFFKSNDIGDESDISFIKQDTKSLFKNLPALRKLSNTITDIGATANVITTGKGVNEIHNYSDILNHLISHITDPNEPIDERDFKQAIEMINAIKKEKVNIKGKGFKERDSAIQSIVFDSHKYSIPDAKKWLKENGYKSSKVDKEANTIRFRQIEPSRVEKEGLTEYRTKELGKSGINLIIAYNKNKISNNNIEMSGGKMEVHHYHHMIHYPKSDSETETDSSSDEKEGGKINIGKAFKKMGSDIKKGFQKDIERPVEKVANQAGKYITSKKGGLSSDLITYGIPATTGAILGALGSATGNPALGVAGSALGSKIGSEYIAPAVHKSTGAGVKSGRFVKGSKEAKEHMARIRNMKKN